MDVLRINDRAIHVIALKGLGIDFLREVQFVGDADHSIIPFLVFLHDNETADRPMILAVL